MSIETIQPTLAETQHALAPSFEVSIVIPVHNCWELTNACLESIQQHTTGSYEVIVIDDASDKETKSKLESLIPAVQVLRNEERRSFSYNINKGASVARGKYLCLLNNDTEVTPGWLGSMVSVLEQEPDIGVLGNKHLFPKSDLLHHCGVGFDETSHPIHLHPHSNPALPAVNYQRDLQCVSFACVLIPATAFKQLGGLDEVFKNGSEDCDFCLRSREAGYRVTYTPASLIYHHGQSTPGRKDFDSENERIFREKWAGRVDTDLHRITREDRAYNKAQARKAKKRRMAPPGIHFAVDLGEGSAFTWVAVELILALLEQGEDVSVQPSPYIHSSIEPATARRLRRLMRKKPCGTYHLGWGHYWSQHLKKELFGEVNAEFFSTNYRYPGEDRRLDLWMRHMALNGYHKLPVSQFAKDALTEIGIPEKECTVVPHGYAREIDELYPNGAPQHERSELHILHVTNSHDLYRYGTDIALDALDQAFTPDDPVVVHIKDYGASSGSRELESWLKDRPTFPRVEWHRDFLSKADLIRLYAQADVLCAPCRGEAFGMKMIDAMALGVPVIMPAFGGPVDYATEGGYIPIAYEELAVGDCYDTRNHFIGDGAVWCEANAEDLTETLAALPSRKEELAAIGEVARNHVQGAFSWDRAAQRLRLALEDWRCERKVVDVRRNTPRTKSLSVIIPTKNRVRALEQTLNGYAKQTRPSEDFELVIINDHGDYAPVEECVDAFRDRLDITLLNNAGTPGPAAARNLGIELSKGEIVLITGDDVEPDPGLVEAHLRAHERHAGHHVSFVGHLDWHPDLEITSFMKWIGGEGGQQFNYRGMKHGRVTQLDRFYTANVSLKRDFLLEEHRLFDTNYPFAAYEDIELSHRLDLRGMELRYIEDAMGYHDHPVTVRSFAERQRKVGRMLTRFALQRPAYVPDEHTAFLDALEFAHSSSSGIQDEVTKATDPEQLIEFLLAYHETYEHMREHLKEKEGRPILDNVKPELALWLRDGELSLWETLNELVIRTGMAEEWAGNEEEAAWARRWAVGFALPKFLGKQDTHWKMPFVKKTPALFPHSRLAYVASRFLRTFPVVGTTVVRLEHSRVGRRLRDALQRRLSQ